MTSKFRLVAILEAVSFLLLLAATLVHRGFDGPDAVSVLGPIHGFLFLAYVMLALLIREDQGWSVGQLIIVIVLSALPFGALYVHNKMVRDPAPSTA
jgi:integral membrane protein